MSSPQVTPKLDEFQRTVVAHRRGPLLVLAGPGTGKTTTIVEAVATRMVESTNEPRGQQATSGTPVVGQPPVLVLTFGRAAADELRERIATRIGTGVLPTVATFHSFSYALLREFSSADEFATTPRLIDAADQDARLREMLTNAVHEGRVPWPSELDAAIGTQGLAEQVRELLARAQLLGFDEVALRRAAEAAGIGTWAALADFLGEYLDVLDASGVLDYSELIHRAVVLAADPGIADVLRRRYRAIYVDEYQDTDPAQVQLLQALTSTDSTFVAVGDPDQSIYGFRGADVGGILRFRDDFPTTTGEPPQIVVLRETRRFGSNIAQAAGRVIRRVGLGKLPAQIQREHRSPICVKPDPGSVEIVTFDSTAAQAVAIADRIRRARLTGEVSAWSEVAVIVRSAVSTLPLLAQALESAGVPIDLVTDEIPLREHRAVKPLLEVISVASDVNRLTVERTKLLLFSAMIGIDGLTYRRLARALRNVLSESTSGAPPKSDHAVRRALTDDEFWREVQPKVSADLLAPIATLRGVLAAATVAIAGGAEVQQVLWAVWSATDWSSRLARTARGSGTASRAANRDLDSVLALFRAAARADEAFGIARPVDAFLRDLESQSINTSARGNSGSPDANDAVALLTAHRAKGLQWPKVFIVGVQEEGWPDLRSRPSLLIPDRLHADGIGDPPRVSELLEAERRLFYVACTRAQDSLVVTAVANAGQSATSGEQPSRFLAELTGDGTTVRTTHEPGYQLSSLNMSSVVAALRATLEAPDSSEGLKQAAAARLAQLAHGGVGAADPRRWWGLADWTHSGREVRPSGEPLRISGSSWSQLDRCSLAWFLQHEAQATTPGTTATAFGSVIHELADAVTRGDLPPDSQVLTEQLASVWPALSFEADWQQADEFSEARDAIARFLQWSTTRTDQRVIGSELRFDTTVQIPGDTVRVTGSVDRLEADSNGQLHIFDLKTQRVAETGANLESNRQLALYQLAANSGAFDDVLAEEGSSATAQTSSGSPIVDDASLVLLRIEDRDTGLPKVQRQAAIDSEALKAELAEAVAVVRNEEFVPTKNRYCDFCDFRTVCPLRKESGEVAQ